jgi:hypothetical protein
MKGIKLYIGMLALAASLVIVLRIPLILYTQLISIDSANDYANNCFSRVDSMSHSIPYLKEFSFLKGLESYLTDNPEELNVCNCLSI